MEEMGGGGESIANLFSSKHLKSIYITWKFVEYLKMWTFIN